MSFSTVSTSNSIPVVSTPQDSSTTSRIPQKTLNQQDFLKLLTVQLSQQDPMKPADDTSFIGQMAQFSALQQSTQMATTMNNLQTSVDLSSASTMLGRSVTVKDTTGNVSGTVSGVDASDGTPKVMINGKSYSLSSILNVQPAVAQPAA